MSIAIGDRVTVSPEHPEGWTDTLYRWINGREGIVDEIGKSLTGEPQYLIKFDQSIKTWGNHSGSDAWWCSVGDLR